MPSEPYAQVLKTLHIEERRHSAGSEHELWAWMMRFSELVRLLKRNGFRMVREKGSIRYYTKPGVDKLIRIDYQGAREVPTGTCNAILKAAGLRERDEG